MLEENASLLSCTLAAPAARALLPTLSNDGRQGSVMLCVGQAALRKAPSGIWSCTTTNLDCRPGAVAASSGLWDVDLRRLVVSDDYSTEKGSDIGQVQYTHDSQNCEMRKAMTRALPGVALRCFLL